MKNTILIIVVVFLGFKTYSQNDRLKYDTDTIVLYENKAGLRNYAFNINWGTFSYSLHSNKRTSQDSMYSDLIDIKKTRYIVWINKKNNITFKGLIDEHERLRGEILFYNSNGKLRRMELWSRYYPGDSIASLCDGDVKLKEVYYRYNGTIKKIREYYLEQGVIEDTNETGLVEKRKTSYYGLRGKHILRTFEEQRKGCQDNW